MGRRAPSRRLAAFRAGRRLVASPAVRLVLACLILPNAPFWLLHQRLLGEPQGWFNLDYILVAVASLYMPRALAAGVLVLAVLLDFAHTIALVYYFQLLDFVQASTFLGSLPSPRLACWSAGLLAGAVLVATAVEQVLPRWGRDARIRVALAGLCLVLGLQAVNIAGDGLPQFGKNGVAWLPRVARYPEGELLEEWTTLRSLQVDHVDTGMQESATEHAMALLRARAGDAGRPNVVQVLAESWGLSNDRELAHVFSALYADPALRARYDVFEGHVAFQGATISGEMRELCDSRIGLGVMQASSSDLKACLPWVLKRRGYGTMTVHGYYGTMYGRKFWFRTVGFDSYAMRRVLEARGLPLCGGAFPGICDAAIAQWIGDRLVQPPGGAPQFVHWVTLNTHLPLQSDPAMLHASGCERMPFVQEHPELCMWLGMELRLHGAIRALAERPDLPETAFVIVGDHAPPFAERDIRAVFSQTDVPYVLLLPKHGPAARDGSRPGSYGLRATMKPRGTAPRG